MPRTKTPRETRSLRLFKGGIAAVQGIADRDDISWCEAARRCLAWATRPGRPMPPGWHPGADQSRT